MHFFQKIVQETRAEIEKQAWQYYNKTKLPALLLVPIISDTYLNFLQGSKRARLSDAEYVKVTERGQELRRDNPRSPSPLPRSSDH